MKEDCLALLQNHELKSLPDPYIFEGKENCLALWQNRELKLLSDPFIFEGILKRDDRHNEIEDGDSEKEKQDKVYRRKVFNAVFDFYVERMLTNVAGVRMWGPEVKYFEEVSKSFIQNANRLPRITASTEAFAILCYKNCWKKWNKMHKDMEQHKMAQRKGKFECPRFNKKKPDENCDYATIYTDSATGQKKLGGWNKEGLKEYNRLMRVLIEEREKPGAAQRFSEVERACIDRLVKKRKIVTGSGKINSKKKDEDDDAEFEKLWIVEKNY